MAYEGTQAQSGSASALYIGSAFTTSYTALTSTLVGEVVDVVQSGKAMGTAAATNFESVAEEFITTLLKPGNFAVTLNRVAGDTGQVAVKTAFDARPNIAAGWTITLGPAPGQTVGDSYSFNAIIEGMDDLGTVKPDGIVQSKMTLKVSGGITLIAGSSGS